MPKVTQHFLNFHRLTCIFGRTRKLTALQSVHANKIKHILLESLFIIVIKNTFDVIFSNALYLKEKETQGKVYC